MTAVAHVGALALGVATVTGTLVWSSAARHVVATPARYGANWDAVIGAGQFDSAENMPLDGQLEALNNAQASLSVAGDNATVLGRGIAGMVETDGERVEVLQIEPLTGGWWPPLIAGRVPQNDREVTVGRGLIEGGVRIGDSETLAGQSFTVVGEHVSSVWSNGEFGVTVAARSGALSSDVIGFPNAFVFVSLTDRATADDLQATVGVGFSVGQAVDSRPNDVTNLGRVGGLTDLLLLLGIVLTFGILANGLAIATTARRRDHATLRALGAQHATIAGTVGWHATIVAAVGGALGVILGAVAGAAMWRHTASVVFVGDALRRPWAIVLAVLVGLTGAGLLVAAAIGVSAARRSRMRLTRE